MRPAVMFGPDDAFLNTLINLLRRLPVYPMFGRGETRLQPADVADVGEAVAKVMQQTGTEPLTVECGGPRLFVPRAAQDDSARSKRESDAGAGTVRGLARHSLDRGDAAGRANHAQLGGVDADRYRGGAGRARLRRSWDFAAADGRSASEHATQGLIRWHWGGAGVQLWCIGALVAEGAISGTRQDDNPLAQLSRKWRRNERKRSVVGLASMAGPPSSTMRPSSMNTM
jgi:hypothetical protein